MMSEYRSRYTYRDLQELVHAARCEDQTLARVLDRNRRGEMSPEEAMTFAALILAADNAYLREELTRLRIMGVASPATGLEGHRKDRAGGA